MNRLIAWFAENHVAANLLMLLLVVGGIFSLPNISKEIIPDVSLEMVVISVPYPGASPTEVEKAVLTRVESAIADIEGVKDIESTAAENLGLVRVKIDYDYNLKEVMEKIKNRVDGISSFPKDVLKPTVQEIAIRNLVTKIIVSGPADERSLKNLAQQIRQDLLEKPEISQVELADVHPEEMSIELSEAAMQRYDMSFSEVVMAIQASSFDSAGGQVESNSGAISLGIEGKATTADEYAQIVLRSDPEGGRLLLGDVATIIDGASSSNHTQSRFNGQPAVSLRVFRVGKQDILEISDIINAYIQHPERYIPDGISLSAWDDNAKYFRSRINFLVNDIYSGFILVFISLLLFLRFKLAFWVSLGIPVAVFATLFAMPYLGASINMITTFAFLMVSGISVDDAIIVGENIHSHNQRGIMGREAAIKGAQEVAEPVIYALLTTAVAFVPLMFVPGPEGKLIQYIPIVVMWTLFFSVVEVFLILPSHLSGTKSLTPPNNLLNRFISYFSDGMEHFIQHRFRPFLGWTLRWRYACVSVFGVILILAVSTIVAGWINVRFFSEIEGDLVIANVEFASSSPARVTDDAVKRIEEAAKRVKEELLQKTGSAQVGNLFSVVGKGSDNKGEVILELAPAETRTFSGEVIARKWRDNIGSIPDIVSLEIKHTLNSPSPNINLKLYSQDLAMLKLAADDIKKTLAAYPGVYEIRDSYQKGNQELNLTLKPAGRDLGLNASELANQVRQAFHGTTVQTVQRGEDEVKVVVRLPADERNSLWTLENMSIRLPPMPMMPSQSTALSGPENNTTPLLTVADIDYGTGPTEIQRSDRKRILQVQARVDESVSTDIKVMDALKKDLLNDLKSTHPGVTWGLAGAQKSKQEAISYLIKSFSLALVAMYMLMAALFRSYSQPLMVMLAIPFGMIGALLGHLITGLEITVWSVAGMIAASGVVANDSIVLVEYINRSRLAGVPLGIAIRESGASRFRPIVLTSLTTFGGIAPLMLERNLQAQFLIPMAVSLGFGVLFATFVSLILIPAVYYILHDLKEFFGFKDKAFYASAHQNATLDNLALAGAEQELKLTKWNSDLDGAYHEGYKAGKAGKHIRSCPYEDDAHQASWEAGWHDANAKYKE